MPLVTLKIGSAERLLRKNNGYKAVMFQNSLV